MAKIATFLIMAVVWVVLSGMFDPFHLSLGVICCGLVAHFSSESSSFAALAGLRAKLIGSVKLP